MSKINNQIMIQTLQNIWNHSFLTSCLLYLLIGVNHAALAEYKKPETTQNDAPKGESTSITGIRGGGSCSEETTTNLTALAPYSHTGLTVNTHPTFAWHIGDRDSYPVQFRLYEFDATKNNGRGKTLVKETLSSSPGIMTYSLPSELPGLAVNQKYVWQVIVICNPNSPSQSLVVGTDIKVVDRDVTQLNSTDNRAAKAEIYAQAGLWYDAFAEVALAPDNPQAQAFTTQLLQQLAAIEQQDNDNSREQVTEIIKIKEQHRQQLNKIVEALSTNSSE